MQLTFLSDQELWQAARLTLSAEDNERMQMLLLKRQDEGLTDGEEAEAQQLLQRYDHVMLVRAQSMALLRERGHDISVLLQPRASR